MLATVRGEQRVNWCDSVLLSWLVAVRIASPEQVVQMRVVEGLQMEGHQSEEDQIQHPTPLEERIAVDRLMVDRPTEDRRQLS